VAIGGYTIRFIIAIDKRWHPKNSGALLIKDTSSIFFSYIFCLLESFIRFYIIYSRVERSQGTIESILE
jgi:hypothetical protein